MIHLSNKLRYEISKHDEPISPFMSLVVEGSAIKATRQLLNKLYTIELEFQNAEEALVLLGQLSQLGDEAFKLYCEIKKSSDI